MEYFLSHIGYVVVVAVILAALALVTVLMAQKNEENRRKDAGEDGGTSQRCDFNCGSCSLRGGCDSQKDK